jgi:hypothetical protein
MIVIMTLRPLNAESKQWCRIINDLNLKKITTEEKENIGQNDQTPLQFD